MTGETLRDEGLEKAGSGLPVGVQISWEERARWAILRLCLADGNWTAEDVRKITGDPPHANSFGVALNSAAKAGLIRPAGVTIAKRPSRHASLLRVWCRA